MGEVKQAKVTENFQIDFPLMAFAAYLNSFKHFITERVDPCAEPTRRPINFALNNACGFEQSEGTRDRTKTSFKCFLCF